MGKTSKQSNSSIEIPLNIVKPSGYTLDGFLTYRDDQQQCGPVIIFVHGTLSSYDHNFTNDLTQKLAIDYGIRSFRYNSRFGASEAEPNHRYRFSGYEDDLDDIRVLIKSLKQLGFTPWCLFGHSRGANDALLYAAKYSNVDNSNADNELFDNMNLKETNNEKTSFSMTPSVEELALQIENSTIFKINSSKEIISTNTNNVVAVDNEYHHFLDSSKLTIVCAAPRFDMKKMSTTLFTTDQLEQISREGSCMWHTQHGELIATCDDIAITDELMNMEAILNKIPFHVPILLLHGTEDELIPIDDAYLYKKCRESIDLTVVEGARHAFRGKKPMK
eukprot:gene17720-24691_t